MINQLLLLTTNWVEIVRLFSHRYFISIFKFKDNLIVNQSDEIFNNWYGTNF